jgi:hypothetical protein
VQISDLPAPVTAAKAHWVAGEGSLSFTPTDPSTNAMARCASAVVRQAANGYVLDYVTSGIETPNDGYENDPEYLRALQEHESVAGKLIAVHRLRPGNGRSLRQIMGDAEYEKLQNMWARGGNRCRWAVAFPIVETFDIPSQPDAAEIFGRESYLRLFAHPTNLLRPLTADERAKLVDLTITPHPATNAWMAIEDETAMALRDEPAIPPNIKRNIEIDKPSEEFFEKYFRRNNVEATFSAIYRVLQDGIRHKTATLRNKKIETSMKNEFLAAVVAHNLRVVIRFMYLVDMKPDFRPVSPKLGNQTDRSRFFDDGRPAV